MELNSDDQMLITRAGWTGCITWWGGTAWWPAPSRCPPSSPRPCTSSPSSSYPRPSSPRRSRSSPPRHAATWPRHLHVATGPHHWHVVSDVQTPAVCWEPCVGVAVGGAGEAAAECSLSRSVLSSLTCVLSSICVLHCLARGSCDG